MNSRTANSTIQGFFYQFEKTLYEFLNNNSSDIITVEGIEDIDVDMPDLQNFIQCKYHESQENFQISLIEKPIIQMLKHWCCSNQERSIVYKLYCYFPNKTGIQNITIDDIKNFINKLTPEKLEKYKETIRKHVRVNSKSVEEFISRFSIQFGESYSELKTKNIEKLKELGFNCDIIKEVVRPNAISIVHDLAIRKAVNDRKMSAEDFLKKLKTLDKVLLWKYAKYFENYKQILTLKRKYLQENLNSNHRNRCFVFDTNSFEDYVNSMVVFIKEFLDKFQYKNSKLHLSNEAIPTFVLVNDLESFKLIHKGLKSKNINSNVGFIFDIEDWTEEEFYKDAVINLKKDAIDFRLRLLFVDDGIIENRKSILVRHTPDDLFIVNTKYFEDINLTGCNKEVLQVKSIAELKYVLNMVRDYE